jgi:hypothetical protein
MRLLCLLIRMFTIDTKLRIHHRQLRRRACAFCHDIVWFGDLFVLLHTMDYTKVESVSENEVPIHTLPNTVVS